MTIIIGIDPHKATHTAVAIGSDESELAHCTTGRGGTGSVEAKTEQRIILDLLENSTA